MLLTDLIISVWLEGALTDFFKQIMLFHLGDLVVHGITRLTQVFQVLQKGFFAFLSYHTHTLGVKLRLIGRSIKDGVIFIELKN